MKLGFAEVFVGVSPTVSVTGDGLRLYIARRAGRFPVEGMKAVTLDGGISSSKPSEKAWPPFDLAGIIFLNRLFAGVALTWTAEAKAFLGGALFSPTSLSLAFPRIHCQSWETNYSS